MSQALVPALATFKLEAIGETPESVVENFFGELAPSTVAAYRRDLRHFARFVGVETIGAAACALLTASQGKANAIVRAYKGAMLNAGLAPATCNRRLSALRSLAACAHEVGFSNVLIGVRPAKSEATTDTRGPGADAVARILEHLAGLPATAKNLRDRAMVALLADLSLRNREVRTLDREHLDVGGGRLYVLRKARRQRQWVSVPPETLADLRAWLAVRDDAHKPLFYSLGQKHRGSRLAGIDLWTVVRNVGKAVGIEKLHPHSFRHTGITTGLDEGADVREAQRYAGHSSVQTTMGYDDNRQDLAYDVACKVAARYRRAAKAG